MPFSVFIEPAAINDIQSGIDYYDNQQIGLGEKFESTVFDQITSLELNPFYQIRYDDVRCLPIKSYPYMLHFTVDENQQNVIIRAVLHTSLDPQKWLDRNK